METLRLENPNTLTVGDTVPRRRLQGARQTTVAVSVSPPAALWISDAGRAAATFSLFGENRIVPADV
jgi:hypothetical protein